MASRSTSLPCCCSPHRASFVESLGSPCDGGDGEARPLSRMDMAYQLGDDVVHSARPFSTPAFCDPVSTGSSDTDESLSQPLVSPWILAGKLTASRWSASDVSASLWTLAQGQRFFFRHRIRSILLICNQRHIRLPSSSGDRGWALRIGMAWDLFPDKARPLIRRAAR